MKQAGPCPKILKIPDYKKIFCRIVEEDRKGGL